MIVKPYQHQLDIWADDKKVTGLFLGTGATKTLIALVLAKGRTLVLCPKTQRDDKNWERENEKNRLGVDLTVKSREDFKPIAHELDQFDTVIIDEGHVFLGVEPYTRQRKRVQIPKASQTYDILKDYLERKPPKRLYIATATIMRSPMTVWAASQILGYKDASGMPWDFYAFRSRFYFSFRIPGMGERWKPKEDDETKDLLASLVKKLGYTGRLEDFFDVPPQTYKTIHVELTKRQKERIKEMRMEYPEPIVRVGKIHQIENGVLAGDEFSEPENFENGKVDKILELACEFPRIVVFAKYRAQIDAIEAALRKEGRKVLTLTGDTKDRRAVISEANTAKSCVFVAQAQISAGWELPEYPCMVFASRTYSFVDYDQAVGRIQRANNIKKNLYIHLVVKGGVDEAVHQAIESKKDFNERIYANS